MSYVITPTYGATKTAAAVVTNIVNLPGAGALSYIHRTGSTFITGGTVAGDGAVITGSGAGNDGTHLIVEIPDEEVLIVRANLTNEAGVASVAVDAGEHHLTITDEATTDWDTINTQLAETAYVTKRNVRTSDASNVAYSVFEHCIRLIKVNQTGATTTVWTSEEEVVYNRQSDYESAFNWQVTADAGPGDIEIVMGKLENGADRRSYHKGSAWLGVLFTLFANQTKIDLYGSFLVSAGTYKPYDGGKMFGSIINGKLTMDNQSGAGPEIQDLIIYGPGLATSTVNIADDVAFMDNFILARATGTALWLLAASPIVVSKFAMSDEVVRPFVSLFSTTATFLDLQVDEALDNFCTMIPLPGSVGEKSYTFSPVVADWRGNPINGALVSIFEIDDSAPLVETPVSGSPFTTDANGQINTGAGFVMRTQKLSVPVAAIVLDDFSFRVKIEAAGYKMWDNVVKPTQPDTAEIGLKSIEAAFEGEEALS